MQIALELLAWMPMLALTGKARLWEPRRLRLRLFTAAGQLVTTGRRRILRLARHWRRATGARGHQRSKPPPCLCSCSSFQRNGPNFLYLTRLT